MTVIAHKGGVLATDTAVFQDGLIVGFYPKIVDESSFCWAACGALPEVAAFAEWAKGGFQSAARPPKSDNFGAVVVYRGDGGRVFKCGETFILYDVTHYDAPVVDGAACEFMLGLMHAGYSSDAAVGAAIKRSAWAGGSVSAFGTRAWKWITP